MANLSSPPVVDPLCTGNLAEPLERAFQVFKTRTDKEWSLTDCVSFEIMRERKLTEAFTPDALQPGRLCGIDAALSGYHHDVVWLDSIYAPFILALSFFALGFIGLVLGI